jgi:Arc/MetJ-type ribon-helix-helix transcriptional regulator
MITKSVKLNEYQSSKLERLADFLNISQSEVLRKGLKRVWAEYGPRAEVWAQMRAKRMQRALEEDLADGMELVLSKDTAQRVAAQARQEVE